MKSLKLTTSGRTLPHYEFLSGEGANGPQLSLDVYYNKGNHGGVRGIYAGFQPVEIQHMSRITEIGGEGEKSGGRILLREMGRKSDKLLKEAAEAFDPFVEDIVKAWKHHWMDGRREFVTKATFVAGTLASKSAGAGKAAA